MILDLWRWHVVYWCVCVFVCCCFSVAWTCLSCVYMMYPSVWHHFQPPNYRFTQHVEQLMFQAVLNYLAYTRFLYTKMACNTVVCVTISLLLGHASVVSTQCISLASFPAKVNYRFITCLA